MKRLWILVIFLFPFIFIGQPQGKLFLHTGFVSDNTLGYIQYPQNQYHIIDTIDLDDIIVANNKVLITNDKVFYYDTYTLGKTDSINTSNAYLLAYDNNKLAVTRSQPPYFEVYDFTTKNLIFSLDINKVKSQPVDILLDMGKAYLLFDTSIQIIDLNLQDTLATKTIFSNFAFPAYGQYLINKGNNIYIDAEIATGAPRFSIFSLDKTTQQIKLELFKEFVDTPFEPVLAGNKIYLSNFPSYYDVAADTFFNFQNNTMPFTLCADAVSNSIFLYNPSNFKVSYYNNSSSSSDVSVPTYINKSAYFNEGIVALSHQKDILNPVTIYPNPAESEINIMLPYEETVKEIRITAINGNQLVKSINKQISQRKIDISKLSEGMYFLEIQFENSTYKTKFIKTTAKK
ncbi:MAG: T9SS type A sorting domain-containing protein [Bacteroidetes bacterium]|nr:T9SS type A sorting domain-containing protein [Bacteroidota bacterium]